MTGWIAAAVVAVLASATVVILRRADLKEAEIEARFPPHGTFVSVGGRDVHIVERGNPEGPPLVLIHGAGGNARDMEDAIAGALEEEFRLLIVDRPGHGWTDPGFHPLRQPVDRPLDQARILSEAVARLGAERPIVLGHSFGGVVAMAWALERPAAAAVIVSGPTMPWPGNVHLTYRILGTRLGGWLLAPLVSVLLPKGYVDRVVESVFAPQPVPPGYARRTGAAMATRTGTLRANARQVRTLRPEVVALSERYGEVAIPVEVLHGTADTTVFAEIHAEATASRVQAGRATLLEGVGHRPFEAAGEEIVAAVRRAAARAGLL